MSFIQSDNTAKVHAAGYFLAHEECSLRGVVKGLDRKSGKFRDDSAVGGMSYDE